MPWSQARQPRCSTRRSRSGEVIRSPTWLPNQPAQRRRHSPSFDSRRSRTAYDADLALRRHATLVPELDALVGEQPFREPLRGQLMLALYRSGRQADALEAYGAARATLVEELGAEPGAQLQELHRAILRQDADSRGPRPLCRRNRRARIEEARKTVTLLLADLFADSGSDPELRRDQLRRRREEAVAALDAHGGDAGRTADTRVLGIFGVNVAREDDALRDVSVEKAMRHRQVRR